MQLPNDPIQGALLNTTPQPHACFFWQLQPNNKGWSAKQSKLLMETRTAPGFSPEHRGALLSSPQHAGILWSPVEVTVRRFCCAWCSCPSPAAATDSVFIAAAQGWTRQSWTRLQSGKWDHLNHWNYLGWETFPQVPPDIFRSLSLAVNWSFAFLSDTWTVKNSSGIFSLPGESSNSTSANTGPVAQTIKFCELWTNFYYYYFIFFSFSSFWTK